MRALSISWPTWTGVLADLNARVREQPPQFGGVVADGAPLGAQVVDAVRRIRGGEREPPRLGGVGGVAPVRQLAAGRHSRSAPPRAASSARAM